MYDVGTGSTTKIDDSAAYPRLTSDSLGNYCVAYEKWCGDSCNVVVRKIGDNSYYEIPSVGKIDGNTVLHPKPMISVYDKYLIVGFTDYSGDSPEVRVVVLRTGVNDSLGNLTLGVGTDPCVVGNVVEYRDASSNAIKAALIKITDSGCSVAQNVIIYRYNGSVSNLYVIPVYEDSDGGKYYLAVFTTDGKVHGVLFRDKYNRVQVLSTYDSSEL
ncbi:hypothetical protein [Methanopyrus sp. SNP6]|uniref:hypothetical protein n=1 Tax=Methanopyrus sp. SNP6 TaxID=1937005 RepID=UPI0011E58F8C|nr:hypothetical protein [Methanopyrus sp. SNP6]